jgi:hypothetical protein
MKKILILSAITAVLLSTAYSQQGLTLYHMDRVLQSQWVNPAQNISYNVHIGGLLVPLFGQIPPPLYFNYANNSFYYNHLFHMGEGAKSDSLVMNIPKFMNSLRKTTHMRFDTQMELINIGIRFDNFFLTFALTEKFRYGLSLPKDMFEYVFNGNRSYMMEEKPHDFSSLNLNATHYREFAIGFSTAANQRFNIGGRAKILFGMANMTTEIKTLSLYSNPENYHMTLSSDMAIRSSLPVYFDYEVHGDSIVFDINDVSVDLFEEKPAGYFLNFRNIGMGFDLGASYKLSSEIDLFASITDLGMISWNTNPQNFVSKGSYLFRGIEVDVFDDEQAMEDFVDTLLNTFMFELQENSYLTWLPGSIYLGGVYKFHKKVHFGGVFRSEFYRKTMLPALTLSVNSNLTKWLSAHASYTIANNYGGNIGFGMSARLAFVQWYFVTDNLIGAIFPQKTKNLNLRMGCNIVFGKPLESSASFRE